MTIAALRWADHLAGWAIPDHILAAAPESPWFHDVASFEADPGMVRSTPSHDRAREALVGTGDAGTVLDVGCGGGRSSLALAPEARHVVGVDASSDMLASFGAAAARLGVDVSTVVGRWPDASPVTPECDVVVCHHVLYNVAGIEPFVAELHVKARRRVVIEIPSVHPQSSFNAAWLHFHGLERPLTPTADDALDVLSEMGLRVSVERFPRMALPAALLQPVHTVASLRRRLCLTVQRDAEIAEWLDANPFHLAGELVTIWWDVS